MSLTLGPRAAPRSPRLRSPSTALCVRFTTLAGVTFTATAQSAARRLHNCGWRRLEVQGSLAGDQGTFTIDGSASLELSNGGAAPVIFDGGSATLNLDAPAAFTGAIEEVVVGDAIDLAGITASSATYSGATLTINETNGHQLIYSVSGSLTGYAVTVASDNNGGTLVYWGAAPAATSQYWITGASGDRSDAADWESGSVPTSTDGAVITNTSGVTVNGTAAAYSLTLDGSYLTVSGTLTLGTSLTVDDYARLTLSGGTLSAQSISSTSGGDFLRLRHSRRRGQRRRLHNCGWRRLAGSRLAGGRSRHFHHRRKRQSRIEQWRSRAGHF